MCDIFNEGIDIPETNLLIFLRYTASHTIWLQQLGRGLRKTPNKDYVYVLDFVGSLERINDIQQFVRKVNTTKVDLDDWELPVKMDKKIVYDSTLEVIYNKSAAQVLKLIEDLKYRLTSRTEAINILKDYWNTYNEIPNLKEIEKKLDGITYDQIATHFDSYFGYLNSAIPFEFNKEIFKSTCLRYAVDFYKKNNICPSLKAISNANQYNRLLLCTEQEILGLVGNENQLSDYLSAKYKDLNNTPKTSDNKEKIISDSNDNQENNRKQESDILINKYRGLVKCPNDLLHLSKIEREEIKRVFSSEFYFVKLLQEAK